ncbi:LptA, protein essential for LPS transport across the periplasm [Moritella sp. JT01]|uniref:lipopolysaccharide transport periplasmic protein LptA n=1 Tax=Moritella sp. JT01 TaxID=756698 RepID=UPI0007949672|nr:lipopolysaccharide transport periplasmic protein LptA [Moritella sp. JT01]KXO11247.1 LptA, protein essential for LPS transport across the periplasm [Moritella sp. JT01]
MSNSALALESDFEEDVVVNAKRQEVFIKENRVIFYDSVVVTQGTILIHADKLTVLSPGGKGTEVMIAIGSPATFYQELDDGKKINAESNEIRYELGKKRLILSKNARVRQADSEVKSDKIIYQIDKQEMIAESGKHESDRVITTFTPEDNKTN